MLIGTDVYKHAVAMEKAITLLSALAERLDDGSKWQEKLAGVTTGLAEAFVEMGFADVIQAAQRQSLDAEAAQRQSLAEETGDGPAKQSRPSPMEEALLTEAQEEATAGRRMEKALRRCSELWIQEE